MYTPQEAGRGTSPSNTENLLYQNQSHRAYHKF